MPLVPRQPPTVLVGALLACLVMSLAATASAGAFAGKAVWGPITRNGVNQFPLYRKLGAKIYEDDLYWWQIAPTRPADPANPSDPAYVWPAEVTQAITLAHRSGMQVMLQIIGAPSWANGGHSGFGWAPRDPVTFAQFATAAARRYPSVHLWMVWGEPDKQGNFQPEIPAEPGRPLTRAQAAAPHLYARMLNDAYGALKAVSRRNLVIGGCTFTTGAIDPRQWLENMVLPDGRPPRLDMWAHNPFSYSNPSFTAMHSPFDEVQFSDLPELEGWLRGHFHRTIPLFLSEFEIPTAPDDTFNFYVNPRVAARWVASALRLAHRTPWIYTLGWINLYDDLPLESGGLLTASGHPKPDFYAFKNG
jgi:hypothetical protein